MAVRQSIPLRGNLLGIFSVSLFNLFLFLHERDSQTPAEDEDLMGTNLIKRLVKRFLIMVCGFSLALLLLDTFFFRGSGYPPPHFNFSHRFPTDPTRHGTAALIVSGGISPGKNHARYWNNISLAYMALRCRGVERIIALQSDGADPLPDRQARSFLALYGTGKLLNSLIDLDGNGTPDISGPATRNALRTALRKIGATLPSDGRLFIFLTDHGQIRFRGFSIHSVLMLWGEEMSGDEFDRLLTETLPPTILVTILAAQCHSKIFLNEITRRNTILMAVGRPYWIFSDQDYSVFPFHFFSSLLGIDLSNGESLPEGKSPTLQKAFSAACARDHAPEWPVMWFPNPLPFHKRSDFLADGEK